MAERRMFTKKITNSDAFIDMPLSTQALYFHLNMEADDDGFNSSPKKIQRMIGASDDDLKLLFAKNFVIPFESGVVVIKHWKLHNYIQSDRYKETVYLEEKSLLETKENKSYTLMDTKCIQNGYTGKVSIDKDSIEIDKDSIDNKKNRKRFVPPTLEEVIDYCNERQNNIDPEQFIDYYTTNGWKVGKNKMKDWKASVRTWERNGYSDTKKTKKVKDGWSYIDDEIDRILEEKQDIF
jgi:hypothetical protein